MSYFDGAFTVSDVYQYRLSDAWPVDGYLDIVPTKIDPLFNLTKFATTGNFSTQLNQIGVGLTVLYPFNRDASTNNFNITVVGDAKAANFSPYTPGYYSAYFDGTDDYLNTPSSSALSFGTGDFTIEGWFYPTSGTNNGLFQQSDTAGGLKTSSGTSVAMNIYTSNSISVYVNGTPQSTGTNKLPFNVWTHLALVRYSGVTKLYINGVLETSLGTAGSMTDTANYSGTYIAVGGYYSTSYLWNGSISNFRIVKGTAVYTSNFTPPTAPLTAIANTSLLTCQSNRFIDNSTNDFAITVSGNTAINPTNPFTPNSSYSTYGSAYFDGTGDYLTVPSNAAFTVSVGDFTIEGWYYLTGAASDTRYLFDCRNGGSNQAAPALYISSGVYYYYVNGAVAASGGTTAANQWVHVALARFSGVDKLYINGISVFTLADTGNYTSSTLRIGSEWSASGSYDWLGNISNFRFIKGTAAYTSNFAPPTLPLTAVTNTSLLTLQTSQPHNNHTFLDRSNNKFSITRVGNAIQGTFSPYNGSWSNYFDGNGDYLSVPSNLAFAFGTGNFTIECFFNLSIPQSTRSMHLTDSTVTNGLFLKLNSGNICIGRTGTAEDSIFSYSFLIDTWYHVAFSRSGTTVYCFVNGGLVGSTTNSINYVQGGYTIGAAGGAAQPFHGYISNLRFVKGTAVYTSAFTPPTAPLAITSGIGILASTPTGAQDPPASNATSLLTCQSNRFIDNGQFGFVITKNGGVAVSSESPFPRSLPPLETGEPSNYGYYFDGSASYISFDSSASPGTLGSSYTIEFWYYPMAKVSTDGTIFTNQDTYNSPGHITIYDRPDSSPNAIRIAMSGAFDYPVTENSWYHISITQNNATGDRIAHFNGYTTSIGGGSNQSPSSTRCYIGRGYASDFNNGYTNINGIISNFRITQSAVYGYMPFPQTFYPIAPLSALPTTTLLTAQSSTFVDNGIYNLTPNVIGNVSIVSSVVNNINGGNVNPFRRVTPSVIDYTPTVYGGSGYFDGTDYLTAPSNAAFTFGTRDFTVEGWFYVNSLGANGFIAFDNRASASAIPFTMGINSSGNPYLYDGTVVPAGSSGITVNNWAHIAWVRVSGVLKMFVNGISVYSAAYTTDLNGSTATIGSGIGGLAGYFLNGYMSDFRIVNGTALYTRNFDPPIAPPTPSGNTSLLLNFTDAAVKDYTMRSNMETMADLKVSSVNSKFGGTSLYFDGTGDYGNISPVSNTLILGTGDFTAEMWINPYSNITTTYPMTIGSEAAGRYSIILVNGTLQVNLYGGTTANLTLTGSRIPANAWSHIAVVRAAGNVRGYYNGNVLPNTQVNSSIIGNGPLRLGSDSSGSANFFGYMDDVRITANARYTANFIPAITYLPTR